MTKFSGGSSVAAVGVAGAIIVSAAAWYTYGRDSDAPLDGGVVVQPDQNAPVALVNSSAKNDVAEPQTAVNTGEQANNTAAPGFDEVRRESDGMTVIAGNAAPGAKVQVLLDGAEVSSATADGSGKFATLVMIVPDGQGRVLSLAQTLEGKAQVSDDQIILAPIDVPDVIANVEPEAVTETPAPAIAEKTEALAQDNRTFVDQPAQTASALPKDETGQTVVQAFETTSENVNSQVPVIAPQPAAQEMTSALPDAPVPAASEPQPQVSQTNEQAVRPREASRPSEVALLKTTPQGVELLNPASPEAMENIELDTISYSAQGDVQLAGRAQSDTQSVRVYLDNAAIINLPVDASGRWRGDLPNVDEGIYTLRVDEVGADGTVTSRVETPFKREAPEVLAQAAAVQDGPLKKITVQKGATLWAIAQERYGDGLLYVNVFTANKKDIRDPDLIYPGQVFDLPD